MLFFKNLVLWFFFCLALSANAVERECVLAPPTIEQLGHHKIDFIDSAPRLEIDTVGDRHIIKGTGDDFDHTYYFVHGNFSVGYRLYFSDSGFADGNVLEIPTYYRFTVFAYRAIETIEGLVFGSQYSRIETTGKYTGSENRIVSRLHQPFTGKELFLTTPVISAMSPDSFQIDLPRPELFSGSLENLVKDIAVTVRDVELPWENGGGGQKLGCFVDGVKDGDTIKLINAHHDRTLYIDAYTYAPVTPSVLDNSHKKTVMASEHGFSRIVYRPPVSTGPTCSHAAPEAASTASTVGFAVYAYGVSSDVTSVFFPTWGDTGGQDDLIWYEGVKQADGTTWKAMVYLGNHKLGNPEYGQFNVHVYMRTAAVQNQWCGTANFVRY